VITQQELVEHTYWLLGLERQAMERGFLPEPGCDNGYGCPGCATMAAFRQLSLNYPDRGEWDPLEIGACIIAAVSQIFHELEHAQ
jgi:hypothetical protein